MSKIFGKKSKIFEKVAGGLFGVIGATAITVGFLICCVLYSLGDAQITTTMHFVSNLGIGENGSSLLFTISCFSMAIPTFPFILYVGQRSWMEDKKVKWAKLNNIVIIIGSIAGVIASIGGIMVGIFSMGYLVLGVIEMPDMMIFPHAIGAFMFFLGAAILGITHVVSMEIRKETSNILRLAFLIVLAMFVLFMASCIALPLVYPEEFDAFLNSPLDYILDMLADDTSTKLVYIRFFEWLYIFGLFAFLILWSSFLLKTEKNISSNLVVEKNTKVIDEKNVLSEETVSNEKET